jgi:phosphatidylinositol glycan class A protein
MVSDFFLPVIGGVEGHIYSLGVELMRRGHRVCWIGLTWATLVRFGLDIVRLADAIPQGHRDNAPSSPSGGHTASRPRSESLSLFLPYFRTIILREKIDFVHGHGSLSSLAHEAMIHAPMFGVRAVFTDHSLFGFADAVGVLTNKLLAGALRNVDGVICVSNTG